ncbi:MAG: NAD(P)H-binding protein [Acidimicrobiia bacterium]
MPVIVIGADTLIGRAVAEKLAAGSGEVRAFITDPDSATELRDLGIKVAVGDVSDSSHVSGAAHQAYSAVVIAEAGRDARERSFAKTFEAVADVWATGLKEAGVQRIIWIDPEQQPPASIEAAAAETVSISDQDNPPGQIAEEVVRLDGLARLD